MSAYTVLPLVADGHTVMVVHYDRAPTQMLPQIIEQVAIMANFPLKILPRIFFFVTSVDRID